MQWDMMTQENLPTAAGIFKQVICIPLFLCYTKEKGDFYEKQYLTYDGPMLQSVSAIFFAF